MSLRRSSAAALWATGPLRAGRPDPHNRTSLPRRSPSGETKKGRVLYGIELLRPLIGEPHSLRSTIACVDGRWNTPGDEFFEPADLHDNFNQCPDSAMRKCLRKEQLQNSMAFWARLSPSCGDGRCRVGAAYDATVGAADRNAGKRTRRRSHV